MPSSKPVNLPEGPTDTISDVNATVRIDVDAIFGKPASSEKSAPINLKELGLDADDIIASLTHKPPEKYQFRGSLGAGGMKVVIQVKDRDTTRDIAMAFLPNAANRPKREILRFIEEARITASLEHPNIVPVHDIGVDSSGSPYFTMKLLTGETLASVLKKVFSGNPDYVHRYNLEHLLRIFLKVCNAVAFAHSRGVLHLDLKPENIQVGDFGEVLLMDWGLARVIAEPETEEAASAPAPDIRDELDPVTRNGVTKGTPGYMAPEQAAGRNSEKNFRTDIYSLGAILYTIVTGKNPLDSTKGLQQMMVDTVRGNIIPPHLRVPGIQIPSGIEAVIMKAMSLDPEDRYASARDLRDEVSAFIGGFATAAERATPLKKTFLLFNRHKVSSTALLLIFFLLLGIGLFLIHDHQLQRGDWIPVYEQQFTDPGIKLDNFSFYNSLLTMPVPPWHCTADGLKMIQNEWMWLTGITTSGDLKIVLEIMTASPGDSITVCMNSSLNPLKYSWFSPVGYSARIAGHSGAADLICRNEKISSQEMIGAADSKIRQGRWNTVVFERSGNIFTLKVNNRSLQAVDLFPIVNSRQGWIGLRSNGVAVQLRSIAVYRLALPEKASPVIAGDTLVEARLYREAVDKYLMLADNYGKGNIAEEALVKAYHTAMTSVTDREIKDELISSIRERISMLFPKKYRFQETISEIDALQFWKAGKYYESLKLVDDLFQMNPNTEVMVKILQIPHRELPPDVLRRLLQGIVRTRNLKRLNLSGLGIQSLETLSSLKLVYLDCSNNKLTSLDGIEKMPLEVLICRNNHLTDLSPLRGIAIRTLDCGNNKITSLDPLEAASVRSLIADRNQITLLDPLSDAQQLEVLNLTGNRISDLEPISNLYALRKLDIGLNPIKSIDSLSKLPLESLALNSTGISDLSPLQGIPLSNLNLQNCSSITDLSPLQTIETLETLYLPPTNNGIDTLRQLPALQYIYEDTHSDRSELKNAPAFQGIVVPTASAKENAPQK